MIIKAELHKGEAYLLDAQGRVWKVWIGPDNKPLIQLGAEIEPDHIRRILAPKLPFVQ